MATLGIFAALVAAVAVLARWIRRPIDAISLLLFAGTTVLFLVPGFFSNRTPIPLDHLSAHFPPWKQVSAALPHNPSLNDVVTQFVPWAKAVRIAWKEGALPLWNRWNGCGMPLAANGQSGAFSPFSFLMFLLPLARAFVLLGASKLFLAAAGSWLWLSELRVSRPVARFGAVVFAFSFALTPWLFHPATAGICLWPWVLFLLELLRDPEVRRKAFVLLTALLFCWALTGHLETVFLGALFLVLWCGLRALCRDLELKILGLVALASIFALGLAAFSLLPQLRVIEASNRLVLARDPAHWNFVPWVPYKPGWLGGFVTSLFPTAYGDLIESPMIPGAAGSIVEMGFGYFGVIGWACVLLIFRPAPGRGPRPWILLALVLFAMGAAMGLPGFRTVSAAIPGLRLAPPLRWLLLTSAAGVPLAALELDRLLKDSALRPRAAGILAGESLLIAALGICVFLRLKDRYQAAGAVHAQIAALLWMLAVSLLAAAAATALATGMIKTRLFAVLLTGLAATELLHQGMRLYDFYKDSRLYPETPLIRFLRTQQQPFRITTDSSALFPNTNVFAAMENVATHDPAERSDYVQFLDRTTGYPPFDYFASIHDFNSPVLNFLNARFLVTQAETSAPGTKWTPVYRGPDGSVFENRDVLPRFYAPRTIVVTPPTMVSEAIAQDLVRAFGPALSSFLRRGDYKDEALVLKTGFFARALVGPENGAVEVRNVRETTNGVTFDERSRADGGAVVIGSLVNDGGWSGQDEGGKRLEIGWANGPFMAIAVSPGEHRVTLHYLPPGSRCGAMISLASLVAFVLFGTLWIRR